MSASSAPGLKTIFPCSSTTAPLATRLEMPCCKVNLQTSNAQCTTFYRRKSVLRLTSDSVINTDLRPQRDELSVEALCLRQLGGSDAAHKPQSRVCNLINPGISRLCLFFSPAASVCIGVSSAGIRLQATTRVSSSMIDGV